MKRISFKEIWFNLAKDLAQRSECKRLKVGSVLVNSKTNKIISTGYNGGPKGQKHKCLNIKGNCGCLHSETNCLLSNHTNEHIQKSLFVTYLPCKYCATAIVNCEGIKEVYYLNSYRDLSSIKILKEAGIKVIMYSRSK